MKYGIQAYVLGFFVEEKYDFLINTLCGHDCLINFICKRKISASFFPNFKIHALPYILLNFHFVGKWYYLKSPLPFATVSAE